MNQCIFQSTKYEKIVKNCPSKFPIDQGDIFKLILKIEDIKIRISYDKEKQQRLNVKIVFK